MGLHHLELINVSDLKDYENDLKIAGFPDRTIDTYLRVLRKVPYELPGTVRDAKHGWG